MSGESDRRADERLLDAIQAFVATHGHSAVQHFKDGVAGWGDQWTAVAPAHLPAADILASALSSTTPETHGLADLFDREKSSRRWEQSYSKSDGLVGEDMLAGYGFAEVIGRHGPFLSSRVRAGIGVWGPGIDYPAHRHAAEEVYVLLGGSAEFHFGDGEAALVETRQAGDAVFVPSLRTHGFRTRQQPLAVLYVWQAGDLREKSTFA